MALDKLVDGAKLTEDLTAVADAIREKGGTSEELQFPEMFVEAIDGMSGGAPELNLITLRVTDNVTATGFQMYGIKYNESKKVLQSQSVMIPVGTTKDVYIPNGTNWFMVLLETSGNAVPAADIAIESDYVNELGRDGKRHILQMRRKSTDPLLLEMTIKPAVS